MRKICLMLFSLIAGLLLWGDSAAFKHSFADGEYAGWRQGGELLKVTRKSHGVELQASELSFARFIKPLQLTPGRSYRVRVQGAGPLDIKIRRLGAGVKNDAAYFNVFKNSPAFEFIYTPPAEYRAAVRLMLCPAQRNVPAVVEQVEVTPLGPAPVRAALTDEELKKIVLPPVVRGFVFQDGALTEKRILDAGRLHGNFFRVRLRDVQELSRAREVCRLARKHGFRLTLEFMNGGEALNHSSGLARLLKTYPDVIWAVRPAWNLSAEGVAAFRKVFPEVRIIQELVTCQESELLNDCKIVYCTRIDNEGAVKALKRLRVRYPVPVLVTVSAEMAMAAERENWSFVLDVTDASLEHHGAVAERALVKNASPEVRAASLIRAVNRARKPGSLVFTYITDTHYQKNPPFSVSPRNYDYTGSLDTMRRMAEIAKNVKADFIGHGGDVLDGIRPPTELKRDLSEVMKVLQSAGVPVMMTKGNHDDGSLWSFRQKNASPEEILSEKEWFDRVVKKELATGAVGDRSRPDAGYFYRDFPASKTRVIVLNGSENPRTVKADGRLQYNSIGILDVGARQLNWLAGQALDFRDKPDRKEWGVLINFHVSLAQDTAINVRTLNGVLEAFLNGGAYTGESFPGVCGVDPGKVSCDFTEQGPMKFHGSLSGHVHHSNLAFDHILGGRLLTATFSTALASRSLRNTAAGESFAVCVLDPAENKLSVFRYGRGADETCSLRLLKK